MIYNELVLHLIDLNEACTIEYKSQKQQTTIDKFLSKATQQTFVKYMYLFDKIKHMHLITRNATMRRNQVFNDSTKYLCDRNKN